MQKATTWKTLPREQVSSDLLWGMTRHFNAFLVHSNNVILSRDPMNLTNLHNKRDSGIANTQAIGIEHTESTRQVKEKKAKKKARVIRFTLNVKTRKTLPKSRLVALKGKPVYNNAVYAEQRNLTARSVVKALKRQLVNYRADLVPLAFERIRRLHRFKRNNKRLARADAKKAAATVNVQA